MCSPPLLPGPSVAAVANPRSVSRTHSLPPRAICRRACPCHMTQISACVTHSFTCISHTLAPNYASIITCTTSRLHPASRVQKALCFYSGYKPRSPTGPLNTCSLLLLPPLFACIDTRGGPLNMFP